MAKFDIIYIRALQVETQIGIYAWEKQIKQPVLLSLEMAADIKAAGKHDAIKYTLDYTQVAQRVGQFVSTNTFLLLESLAEQVADLVLTEFKVPWLRLQVGKPGALAKVQEVGVIIERSLLAE